MGLFDLFKRDLSNDPDLTRLRDLIIISEKSKYLRRLIEVMATDNVCAPQEIEALRSIAHNMGFSDAQTDDEIRDYCKGLGKRGETVLASYEENKGK